MRPHTKKKLLKTLIYLSAIYLLFRPVWRTASFDVRIDGTKPQKVWEFVSDLSNAKLLSPLIYEFDIVRESGNFDHWEYGAVIHETMSRIPLLTNTNYADFILKPSPNKDYFKIHSTYKSCFFGYACLYSKSDMIFSEFTKQNTKVTEMIEYQCPFALTWLCSREVQDARTEWMKRLQENFQG